MGVGCRRGKGVSIQGIERHMNGGTEVATSMVVRDVLAGGSGLREVQGTDVSGMERQWMAEQRLLHPLVVRDVLAGGRRASQSERDL